MSSTSNYSRYSDDDQRPESIDDQNRRCEEIAAKVGLTIDKKFVFSDSAVTGLRKGMSRRTGFRHLLDAIESRQCDVVIADEVSRLSRDLEEGARLMRYVDELGVRFITGDGIDTAREGWRMMWTLKLMQAKVEVENTGYRTIRGMKGQLERGYQIAQAPFGYRPIRDMTESGRVLGTRWVKDEAESEIVCKMYRLRHGGLSAAGIATCLQKIDVLPPGASRKGGKPYWRPASVYRVLANPIYRGVFIWNGSSFVKSRAARRRQVVDEVVFERPSLRLVSDEVWYACNSTSLAGASSKVRSPRGGGKHLFAGLTHCADCGCTLSVGGSKGLTLYCPQCEAAVRVGARSGWIGYTSVGAARSALEWVLKEVFTGELKAEFHRRLEVRLHEGPVIEEREARARLIELEASIQRLKILISNPKLDASVFEGDMASALTERRVVHTQLERLKAKLRTITPEVMAIQQAADPLALIHVLLNGGGEMYQVRATLRRLLTRFEFVARPTKGVSIFRIGVHAGAYVAEATGTTVIDREVVEFEVCAGTTARRPVQWEVSGRRLVTSESSTT
jgi:DNA invertase Pin-like site-specific DNA recombinase